MGSITDLNSLPLKMQTDYPMIEHEAESIFEASRKHVALSLGVLAIMVVLFLIVSAVSLRRLPRDSR